MGLKMSEVIMILVIALLFFGTSKLGDLGTALGKGIKNFKREMNGQGDEPASLQSANAVNGQASTKTVEKQS
jgi:sec-independent protein translocase protein TatA